ncbi:MAG: hypothetical protein SF053_05730 [Bacteroidia bacterium]|nr:hypothetical protein [Bacteroidia bacterium]
MNRWFCLMLATLISLIPSALAAQQEDLYTGTYTHVASGLVLAVMKLPDIGYEGKIAYQGQQYLVSAVRLLGVLSGSYTYEGHPVSFSLARMGEVYYLTSDGVSLEVTRTPYKALPAAPVVTQAPAGTSTGPAATQWQQRLAGKQLLYLYTGNGYSEKSTLDLCPDGTFTAGGDAHYISTGGGDVFTYSGDDGTRRGTWQIAQQGGSPVLRLSFGQGGVRTFALTSRQASNEIGLDGKRYFVQPSGICR